MKSVLIGLLVLVLIGGAAGGTWYYMDMQLKAANEQITVAQGETTAAKTQLMSVEAELKAKADLDMAEQELLTNLEAFMMSSGTGVDMTSLAAYYDSSVMVEGTLTGSNLQTYTLALQKYAKTLSSNEGVKATPIKLASGDWTAIVSVKEKNILAPLVLNQSGSVVRAPAKLGQEITLTLAKWENGKIVEQYEFPYVGDVSKSNLLKYVSASGSLVPQGSETAKMMEGVSGSDTPNSVPLDDVIPAQKPTSTPTIIDIPQASGATR